MTTAGNPRPVQQADPAARRRALVWLAVIGCFGVAALFAVERWLAGILGEGDPRAARTALASALWYTSLLTAAGTAAFGVHAWRLAARVQSACRFPPPGQPVIRNTVILEGQAAVRRAVALRVIGALLVVTGASLVLVVGFIAQRLGHAAA